MTSLWPSSFDESQTPPVRLLEQQGVLLREATQGLATLDLEAIDIDDKLLRGMDEPFAHTAWLRGPKLANYRYKVLSLAHRIPFFPLHLRPHPELAGDLALEPIVVVRSDEAFRTLVARILQSERVRSVVGSIVVMSRGP